MIDICVVHIIMSSQLSCPGGLVGRAQDQNSGVCRFESLPRQPFFQCRVLNFITHRASQTCTGTHT